MPEPENKPSEVAHDAPVEASKEVQKDGAVRDAAHAAADVEADAVAAVAAAEREANKIAEVAGAKAAEKWLESKIQEIEAKAAAALAELKKLFEDRFAAIEGKLKLPEAKLDTKPEVKPDENPASVASSGAPAESSKRKIRRV